MSGGGSSGTQQTQTQKAAPWEKLAPYLETSYDMIGRAAGKTPDTPYQGPFAAPSNSYQQALPGQIAATATQMGQAGNPAIELGNKTTRGDFLNGNEYLLPQIEATVNPTIQRFNALTLPAIGSAAQEAGAYGGSRQAHLERYAIDDTRRTIADTAAKMVGDNYARERQLQMAGPSLVDQGWRTNSAPLDLFRAAGDTQYAVDSIPIQENLARFKETLDAPWRPINPLVAALGGLGGAGGTTESTGFVQGPQTSRAGSAAMGAMGGAAQGAMLGSMIPGIGTMVGALGGGILGGLGGGLR
jgi:hypothetical protein